MHDHSIRTIAQEMRRIREILEKLFLKAKSARLLFKFKKGEIEIMGKALVVHLNDVPGIASLQEFSGTNGTGVVVPPTGNVTFSSDNPAIATVDPTSGQLAYIAAGTANITGTDDGNNLSDTAALTVSGAVAQSAVLTLTPGA